MKLTPARRWGCASFSLAVPPTPDFVMRLENGSLARLAFALDPRVFAGRQVVRLALQLLVARQSLRRQSPVGQCLTDGATGFGVVFTVAEATARREFGDVGERSVGVGSLL